MSVQQTLDEVNDLKLRISDKEIDRQNDAFKPQIPLDLNRADAYAGRDERPLRVLSLGKFRLPILSSFLPKRQLLTRILT
jgi:hypothetical protein